MRMLPIIFSGPMVRAILDGRKTQTRRLLRSPEYFGCPTGDCPHNYQRECDEFMASLPSEDTGFAIGDRLYVREAYYQFGFWEPIEGQQTKQGRQKWRFVGAADRVQFEEPPSYRKGRHHNDPSTPAWHKRLPRFMPRNLSRLTLTVADVRVERLQAISEDDAMAEGIIEFEPTDEDPAEFSYRDGGDIWNNPRSAFRALWNSINGPTAWDENPWVVALTFTVEQGNIDA